MTATVPAQRCSKCSRELPFGEFPVVKRRSGARVPGSWCRDCKRASNARWYAANRERERAKHRAHYAAHRDEYYARHRAWVEANRERWAAYQAAYKPEWVAANPELVSEINQRASAVRYARIRSGTVEPVDRDVVFDEHQGTCGICGLPVDPADFHVDHIVPLSRGGEHSYANTQVAHPRCNQRKASLDAPTHEEAAA